MTHHIFSIQDKSLITLFKRCAYYQDLQKKLRQHLPADLAPYCQVVGWQKTCMTIAVLSAARLTFLRPIQAKLIASLRIDTLPGLRRIKWKVLSPEAENKENTLYFPRHMSMRASENLCSAANQVKSEPLKAALQKLAQSGKYF